MFMWGDLLRGGPCLLHCAEDYCCEYRISDIEVNGNAKNLVNKVKKKKKKLSMYS